MLILSHSAIFFWLLLTFIAADFIKNENENFNSTEKTNRTLPATEYKESKRFRQHKLHSEDTTVDAGVDDVGAEIAPKFNNANVDETATKNTDMIRNRHSIKTKHKHKRMWHDLSNEQKNNIKMLDNANKTSDTKELIKSNVNDTANSVITNTVGIGDDNITNTASAINHSEEDDNRTDQNNKTDRRSKVRSYDTPDNDDKPKQINAVINEKVKNVAGNEDRLKQSQRISARIATVATTVVAPADNSTNFNAPSHRKKRRRILFSSTQQVPTDESQTSSSPFAPFNTYNFQPVEQNSRRDHNIVPFLDFGRKIGGSIVPRGNVNFVDSLFSEIRSNKPPIESKSQIVSEEEPLHEDMDVTLDRKTIEKNHVPNDRLHLASTNLANYYRRSTTKPPTTNTTNTNASSTCIPPYRIRRPFTANKTLKREVTQNIPLCQYNTTTPTTTITINKPEELKSTEKPKFLKNRTDSTTYKSTSKNDTIVAEVAVTETPRVDVTTPLASQFTTKILSTAVITSVSVKSNDDLTVPIEPYFTIAVDQKPKSELEESRKKSKSEKSLDTAVNTYNSSGVIFSPLNKTKPIQSTVRPSLTFYQRNTSKNYRNVNSRNSQISKILSQLQSQSFGAPSTPTNANYSDKPDSEAVTKQNLPQANVINAFNLSDASIEYLLGGNLSTEASEPQSEPTEVDITTNDSLSQRPAVVIVTVNEKENASAEDDHYNSSSTPTLTAYRNTEKNTENWRYRTNAESDDFSENSTLDSKIYAIFSKTSTLNLTRSEPSMPSTTPSLLARPASKPNSEEFASVGYQIGFHIVTYVLAGLGVIPLIIGIFLITKMILSQNKKQIFEGSEYSSEYNRNPLEFNGGVTSSPIATKLPRVPHHMAHWEIEKKSFPSISLPNNSKWEFPRDKLRLQTILGQGNFGQVWKAEADDISGHEGLTRLVAVKMVKEISSTREKDDLIKELIIMQHLGSHPNVVTLLGCCTEKEPYMLIMEYVMYGKLLSFLRDHRTRSHYFNFSDNGDTLTSRDLTVFAYCVARGMEYLQNNQIIHRDLAARNILVDHNKLCKIADFGMSRHVGDSGQVLEHRQSKGALPIRWMAPESLHYSCYTHKTDVWSFGILMWEIVTLGSMPYASMGARVVMRKVKEGYRLEKPKHCKSQLFNVISKCWYSDPNKRPTFTELKQDLGNLLEDSEHDGNYVDLDSLVEEMNQVVHGSHNEKIII